MMTVVLPNNNPPSALPNRAPTLFVDAIRNSCAVFAVLFLSIALCLEANAGPSGGSVNGYTGSGAGVQAQYTPWQIRKNFLDEHPDVKPYARAQMESRTGGGGGGSLGGGGADGSVASAPSGMSGGGVADSMMGVPPIEEVIPRYWPVPGPTTVTMPVSKLESPVVKQFMNGVQLSDPGGLLNGGTVKAIDASQDAKMLDFMSDPDRWTKPALAAASAMSTSAANSMAGAAVSQTTGAIQFCRHYLVNFTAQAGSSWQSLRNNLFIPMAVLLLLPGAVLAQVRAIVAQGSPVLGEVNPFEGITRSIIAIFMIPASFLVINYGIDLSNSITFSISTEYQRLFGTDMYQDAECAEMRAFPVNGPNQNMNAFLPIPFSLPPIMKDPWSAFESVGTANKLFDPCAGLNISNVADEQSSETMNTNRMMMNGSNAFLAMTWNIMCAFQTVFLYYLWCMGPIVAALWVWPMEKLRGALPSWIEGVITLCFWSLFWNVVVLLMACFRGVSETGTVVMTALNGLATICVWYAFDFSALISEGAGYSMMNAISSSMRAGGGGGGGGGGGAQQASGGMQKGGGLGGPGGGIPMAAAGGVPMGGASMGGGAMGGGSMGAGAMASMAPSSSMGVPGIFPGGMGTAGGMGGFGMPTAGGSGSSVIPAFSPAVSGAMAGSAQSKFSNLDSMVNSQLKNQANSQTSMNQDQINQRRADMLSYQQQQQAQAQEQGRRQQEATLADYVRARGGEMANGVFSQPTAQAQALAQVMQETKMAEFMQSAQRAEMANVAGLFNASNLPMGKGMPPLESGLSLASNVNPGAGTGTSSSSNTYVPGITNLGAAGTLAGPPPPSGDIAYNTVNTNPEVFRSTTMGVPDVAATRSDAMESVKVDWSAATANNNMARESVSDPQPVYMPYGQTQTNTNTEFVTQTNQTVSEPTVQYVPVEVKQERVEIQQVQPNEQHTIVYQQQPTPPADSTPKPTANKPIDNTMSVFTSPPVVPKSNINAILTGMQPGIKPGESAGSLAKDAGESKGNEPVRTEGSLADHLSRLQRGGGRTAPKANDILKDANLPPEVGAQDEHKDEEENKDETEKKDS